jgi:lysozyme
MRKKGASMNLRLFLAIWLCTLIWVLQQLPIIKTTEQKIVAITESTFELISGFEGKRHTAYKDARGLWTIGVGHLIKPTEQWMLHTVLTDAQVEDLFKSDLKWCDDAVASAIRVPLNQNQMDALYSLCFNIGADHFKQSEVVSHLNQNNYNGAANAFMNWVTPAVLKPRREKEKELFLRAI